MYTCVFEYLSKYFTLNTKCLSECVPFDYPYKLSISLEKEYKTK